MMRKAWWMVGLAFLSAGAWGAEVGLVTAVSGNVKLQEDKAAASELKSFVKLRAGDRLTMEGAARLQMVYFEGGRQETRGGGGRPEAGRAGGSATKGGRPPEVKKLPAILVKQLSKTPSPDGNVKAGMVRMRSMPSGGTLESVEKNYADLRKAGRPRRPQPGVVPAGELFRAARIRQGRNAAAATGRKVARRPGGQGTGLALQARHRQCEDGGEEIAGIA
ncbi:MAG: hypothetical protein M5R42_15040 [Rhodocyclaceae bacterium]|nr:hypothetical protein [Rhodocyclaceae bacterium]